MNTTTEKATDDPAAMAACDFCGLRIRRSMLTRWEYKLHCRYCWEAHDHAHVEKCPATCVVCGLSLDAKNRCDWCGRDYIQDKKTGSLRDATLWDAAIPMRVVCEVCKKETVYYAPIWLPSRQSRPSRVCFKCTGLTPREFLSKRMSSTDTPHR